MNSSYHSSLKNLKSDDVERFTLKGKEKYAKVVSIYDGDTCDLAFYLDDDRNYLVRYKCRMSAYNAPKLKETNGELTRDYLAHLCTGGKAVEPENFRDQNETQTKDDLQEKLDKSKRLVYAKFGREGKYGRPVITLYQTYTTGNPPRVKNSNSINAMMTTFVDELEESASDSDMS